MLRALLFTVFAFLTLILLGSCKEKKEYLDSSSVDIPGETEFHEAADESGPLRDSSREELIKKANHLALLAENTLEQDASQDYLGAGLLLRRAYWLFGNTTDAQEAVELFLKANEAENNSDIACSSALELAQLKGLQTANLSEFYRMLFVMQERLADKNCGQGLQDALLLLKAFALSKQELNKLRRKVEEISSGRVASELMPKDRHKSRSSPVFSEHQAVVSPELLEANLKQTAEISHIEHYAAERSARVVVHVAHPTQFKVGQLSSKGVNPGRIFVDIERATYQGPGEFALGGLVEAVRVAQHEGYSRIAVDLNKAARHRVFYLPEPFRLILDLSAEEEPQKSASRRLSRVVLDPGHGGSDPGAIAKNGLREKDITLDIAHRAAPLLAREVGVSTLLTRDVDAYVPLDERAAKANAFHADLFISIHVNSSPNLASRGVMTFVLDASRDRTAAQVAARENHSSEAAAAELANSLSRIESRRRRASSELFARLLQRSTGASLRSNYDGIEDHGVKRAGFYVLAGAAMPAVLYEGSFLSNPLEAKRLKSDDYRQRLADSIVNAVRAYKQGL